MTMAATTFLLLGAVLAAPVESSAPRRDRCYAVRVEAIQKPAQDGRTKQRRYGRRFAASRVLDLRFDILLHKKNDAGLVQLKVYTPSGQLYDIVDARGGDEDAIRSRFRGRAARIMTARVPVAGSHITGRSIYGKWRATVHLDGRDERCAQRRFILDP